MIPPTPVSDTERSEVKKRFISLTTFWFPTVASLPAFQYGGIK